MIKSDVRRLLDICYLPVADGGGFIGEQLNSTYPVYKEKFPSNLLITYDMELKRILKIKYGKI